MLGTVRNPADYISAKINDVNFSNTVCHSPSPKGNTFIQQNKNSTMFFLGEAVVRNHTYDNSTQMMAAKKDGKNDKKKWFSGSATKRRSSRDYRNHEYN